MKKPTPTLTRAIMTPTAIPSTKTPASTEKITEPVLSGSIFLWMARGREPLYTSVDLEKDSLPVFLELEISPDFMVNWSENLMTSGLAFAPYSPLVAYLTANGESTDLWLADIALENREHLWNDNQQWLGQLAKSEDEVNIKWGPNEATLILSPNYQWNGHMVIYSRKTKNAIEVSGACDQVALIPESEQLTVWCSFENGASSPYGFFNLDGDLVFTEIIPNERTEVLDWSFAHVDGQLAFAPKQGDITIFKDQDSIITIPARMLSDSTYRSQPLIQWSADGSKLLVQGYNQKYCPLIDDPIIGNMIERDCWLVVNADTGEILWGAKLVAEEIKRITGGSLEEGFSQCSALSPDSEWLVFCISFGAIEEFLAAPVDNNQPLVEIGGGGFMDLKWVER